MDFWPRLKPFHFVCLLHLRRKVRLSNYLSSLVLLRVQIGKSLLSRKNIEKLTLKWYEARVLSIMAAGMDPAIKQTYVVLTALWNGKYSFRSVSIRKSTSHNLLKITICPLRANFDPWSVVNPKWACQEGCLLEEQLVSAFPHWLRRLYFQTLGN